MPRRGNRTQALPTARVMAILVRVMPWVICRRIGSMTRRCQNDGVGVKES